MRDAFAYAADFDGAEVPGAKKRECGNYKSHDLAGAKAVAKDYYAVLCSITENDLTYPE